MDCYMISYKNTNENDVKISFKINAQLTWNKIKFTSHFRSSMWRQATISSNKQRRLEQDLNL
jgi:hypothetical protein